MMKKPVYEIELELGNLRTTLLTTEIPKTYRYGYWEDDDVEPVGYLIEKENDDESTPRL